MEVLSNGRVFAISEEIELRSVPSHVRDVVRNELDGMRVSQAQRSLRRNLDMYYELDGVSGSGRPVSVEIRADGSDLTIRDRSQG